MRVINANWPRMVSKNKPAIIYVFADTHFGNPAVDLDLLQEHIKQCKKEKAQWLHLGDWIEAITPNDRRFDHRIISDTIEDSWEQARDHFWPIRKQGIAMLSGNHEELVERYYGMRTKTLARELGVPYLGYSGFIRYGLTHHAIWNDKITQEKGITVDKAYTLFLHHGHGMGALLGAKQINLHRMSHKFMANIYLIGHIHTYMQTTDALIGVGNGRMKEVYRHYASAPSYLKGYDDTDISTYAERKAMYPQPVGCLRLKFWREHPVNEIGKQEDKWHVSIEPLLGEER